MLDDLGHSFNNMFHNIVLGLPDVVKAILILLLAWVVAIIVRSLFQKGLVRLGVNRLLGRTPLVEDETEGKKILESVGKLVYFLVFILFLPAVFNTLNMVEVSAPIANMVDQLIGFIPNLIAATIIIVIGVFVARLVKGLSDGFFSALHLDQWFAKISPKQADPEKTQTTISNILANIIYIIVLIPFITIGLEALNIATISQPIQAVLNDVIGLIPNLFIAIILVMAGYYIGKLVGNLLTSLLQGTGINNIYQSLGLTDSANERSFDLAKLLGTAAQALIVLFFTVEALHVINLRILNTIGQAIIEYVPYLLSAVLILGGGLFLANLLANWIKNNTNSKISAMLIKGVIITFAVFMTLDQLHFATSIVNTAFLLVLGGLMIAFAISFGIGGREFAKNRLEKLQEKFDKNDLEE